MTAQILFPGTLAQALQSPLIQAGSRLLLTAGNYIVGDLDCHLSDVTITNYPGQQATIIPASGFRCLLFSNGASNVTLDGLIIDGANVTNECVKVDGGANVTIQNCIIRNAGTHGILVSSDASSATISACTIQNNGTGGLDHGVYFSSGENLTVTGCTIFGGTGLGIHHYGGGAATYEKNYIHNNTSGQIGVYTGSAIVRNNVIRSGNLGLNVSTQTTAIYAYYNTFVGFSGMAALSMQNNSNDCIMEIKDNLMDACYRAIVLEDNNGHTITATLVNNLYSRSTFEDTQISYSVTESGNISASCLPVTDNGAQFIPGIGSPAKAAGVAIGGITTDYGGNSRGNPPTIGAWE